MTPTPLDHEENVPPVKAKRHFTPRRYSAVELLIALVLLLAFTPFVETLKFGEAIEAVLMSLVLLSALFAVTGRKGISLGVLLVLPALLGKWLHHFRPDIVPRTTFHIAALAFMLYVIVHLLRFVLSTRRVDHETLCASIAAYLMMGLLWTIGYTLLSDFDSAAFAFATPGQVMDSFHAFYFSFVTLSTVGYGDITPLSRGARMLAVMEAVTGMFYVAVLVARLVALYSVEDSADARPEGDNNPR